MPRFVVIDTETTGFVPKTHRVMEVAAVVAEDGKIVKEYESLLSLPADAEIPIAVQILTQIDPKDLEGKPTFAEVQPTLEKLLTKDTILVGQNLQFDVGMLRGEGWDLGEIPSVDTAMLASLVFPELPSYSLGFLSDTLGLNHTPKHRALGDVRATYELMTRCIERLQELPKETIESIQEVAEKGPEGYKKFFAAINGKGKKNPEWLTTDDVKRKVDGSAPISLKAPKKGDTALVEEPLLSDTTARILSELEGNTWFAVKNLEALLRTWEMPEGVTILRESEMLIDPAMKKELFAQKSLTADEAILAIKLLLYPAETKTDLPLHGGEYQTFHAKLSCRSESDIWKEEIKKAQKGPAVIGHKELFRIVRDLPELLPKNVHVILDDASMLEDTLTQAEQWTCSVPMLRAAAAGNKELTQCADIVELWVEKTRSEQSIRYLAPSDLGSKESSQLIELLEDLLKDELPESVRVALKNLRNILDEQNLSNRFAWIETMMDGSKTINSVPETVATILFDRLLSRTPTTLLIPHVGAALMHAILDDRAEKKPETSQWQPAPLPIEFPIGAVLENVIKNAKGKSVLLVGSKRMIEDVFVKHSEEAEDRGMTLICQGYAGGHGRMQAEFLAAKGDAMIVLTPWMYEGMELKPEVVDTLIVHTMPFDHPSHAVISRRALRYQNAFGQYSLPRLLNRLFRLTRTFVRHAAKDAKVMVLDERIRTKGYGKDVKAYLETLFGSTKQAKVITKEQMPLL